jgi:hypothetical protein
MLNKKIVTVFVLVASMVGSLQAGSFSNLAIGDVIIGFRISGKDNLVLDAGPISTFTNAAANQVIYITNFYSPARLAGIGTNSLSWAAFAGFDDSVSPTSAQGTLFVTKARPALNTKSSAFEALSASSQLTPAATMVQIQLGANYYYVQQNYNVNNTATAVIEPAEPTTGSAYPTGVSYNYAVYDASGASDFGGSLNGFCENTTPNNFVTAGTVQRSDFWWVPPTDSGAAVKYLGYFELNTNGALTYVAYPSSGVAPVVTTTPATAVTNNIATLNGTVNPSGQSSTVYFQYGPTTSYGSTNPVAGTFTGSSVIAVSTNLTGLNFATTYHFRLVAYNATGTNAGADQVFTTAAIPKPVMAFTRTGTNNAISFQTFSTLTYTVRGTNQLAGSISNWPVITSLAGNNSVRSITNGTTAANMFYSISVQ